MSFDVPGYDSLSSIFQRAYDHAARSKGAERHANGLPFHEQPMQSVAGHHGLGFLLGQAEKKSIEAHNMVKRDEHHRAIPELLGAINYIAGAIIHIEATQKAKPAPTFEVGHRVRVMKLDQERYAWSDPGWSKFMAGLCGKEGTVCFVGDFISVTFAPDESTWAFFPDDLELIRKD